MVAVESHVENPKAELICVAVRITFSMGDYHEKASGSYMWRKFSSVLHDSTFSFEIN